MASVSEPNYQISEQLLSELSLLEKNYKTTVTSLRETKVLTGSPGWDKVLEFELASEKPKNDEESWMPSFLLN